MTQEVIDTKQALEICITQIQNAFVRDMGEGLHGELTPDARMAVADVIHGLQERKDKEGRKR